MKVAAFGEIMLRLTPTERGVKIRDAENLRMNFAGAESNVLTSLASLGHNVRFVTRLPNNPVGDAAIRSLQQYGIRTQDITRSGDRIGTYFLEMGNSIRPSKVVYDRKHSAFSEIGEDEINWEKELERVDYFHFSGINLSLSDASFRETKKSVKVAKSLGAKVSFDLNFRRSLWEGRDDAAKTFGDLIPYADVVFTNEGSLDDIFGWNLEEKDEKLRVNMLCEKLRNEFGSETIFFSARNVHSASKNELNGALFQNRELHWGSPIVVDILDRVGTGDAFAAGCLHGLFSDWEPNKIIRFGVAAYALSHTIIGDQHTSSEEEILAIADGKISGHILR